MGMQINRKYTKVGVNPFDQFEWEIRDSKIEDSDGKVIFEMKNVEVPAHWSQRATDIVASKYFRKAGLPEGQGETSVKQVIMRIVRTIADYGLQNGYFALDDSASVFADELTYMLCAQIGAFNSPVWFNVGLWHEYGIKGEGQAFRHTYGETKRVENVYEYPQSSACFIQAVEDSLSGIMDLVKNETMLFKYGSGTGTNFSNIRGKGEKLAGGGESSGLMSFLDMFDRAAGAIKSGGTCLAPYQHVFTANGPVPVKTLAESGERFVTLSYDPPARRYKAKWAKAWLAGRKNVVRVVTDKGAFDVTYDHPVKLSTGEYVHAGKLAKGMSLFSCTVDSRNGYLRVGLHDGQKGKESFHRLVAKDAMGLDIADLAVHHKDENKLNNDPTNLEVTTQSAHATHHGIEHAQRGTHVFQYQKYPKHGENNAMHRSSDFWQTPAAETYREKQGDILKKSGRASDMQKAAAEQKMLNTAFRVLNAGHSIDTFDQYVAGRRKVIGDIGSKTKLQNQIVGRFGSYEKFVEAVAANNHRVVSVSHVGEMDVYDIEVECPTADDKSVNTGHNFVIWTNSVHTGSGIVVANTRRAAKMVCLDMDHPEIESFITWKMHEEKKAHALINAGYSSDFNGEAYATIGGQNSNNSVRVSDEFMRRVAENESWHLIARTTGGKTATKSAQGLWRLIAEAAWHCADPGVQYDDTINSWNTCPNSGRINASNPCAEFVFLDDTACNLVSLNLTKFLNADNTFDIPAFRHAVRVFFIAQEILVGLSSYPTEQIAKNSHDFRPLGLGYANLGTLLMLLGKPYDSDEGRNIAASITSLMTAHAALTSAEMAKVKGAFEGFAVNREPMLDVISKHANSTKPVCRNAGDWEMQIAVAATEDWYNAVCRGHEHGYRNAQFSVLAPAGTIGLLMDCDTTGIEPDFALVKYKKLAGGGTMKIVNQAVSASLKNLGYGEQMVSRILTEISEGVSIALAGKSHWLLPEHCNVFACANEIDAMGHVRMMAAVQPFLSGAISKTVNLPNSATIEDVQKIYEAGHASGLKSIALYRDGCKASQPLNASKKGKSSDLEPLNTSKKGKSLDVETPAPTIGRRKLPNRRTGFTQEARVGGHKLFVRTGEYPDGKLGEIFVDMHKEGATMRSLMNCLAIAVSTGLQYGVPLEAFVDKFTFTRFEPQGVVEGDDNVKMSTSIVDYIFRMLAVHYSGRTDLAHVKPVEPTEHDTPAANPEGSDTGQTVVNDAPACNVCGHITVRNAACYRCLNCGNSMGCS